MKGDLTPYFLFFFFLENIFAKNLHELKVPSKLFLKKGIKEIKLKKEEKEKRYNEIIN